MLPVLTVLLLFSLINLDVEVRKLAAFLLSSLSSYHIGKFQAGGQLAGDSAVETRADKGWAVKRVLRSSFNV